MIELQPDATVLKYLNLENLPGGKITRLFLRIVADGMGMPIFIPVIVAKGKKPGPILGITAAVHGNELNGVPVVQRIFKEIDVSVLSGIVVGVPVINIPAYLLMQRKFNDDTDLNRIMPGRSNGNTSEVYAYRLNDRIIKHFDYLLDLHTASFGRVNSYYIRANMKDEINAKLAYLQNAQIILNNSAPDSTVRGVVNERGGKAITLEVGDPNKFQIGHIRSGLTGIYNTMIYLGMVDGQIDEPDTPPIICERSYWIYTDKGGVLQVLPAVTDKLNKGQKIAVLKNIFGDVIKQYFAPEDGIVIGKSTHPVAQTGSRILHLGVLKP